MVGLTEVEKYPKQIQEKNLKKPFCSSPSTTKLQTHSRLSLDLA
jgi:hypothetical protein